MKSILVICNPFAGGSTSTKVLQDYRAFAEQQENANFNFYLTSGPEDYAGIEAAVEDYQPDVVSIVGGDGTINEILNVAAVRSRLIHLVPAGSGNDFHRLIYGNISCQQSFEFALADQVQTYDIGTCNDRYFLNGVGIGFDGSVARQTVRMKLPFLPSTWKYWIAIFRNILFYKSVEMTIHVEGRDKIKPIFMLAVANGTDYGGGFKVSPKSNASDGLLDVVEIGKLHPFMRLLKVPKVEKGKHLEESFVEHYTVKNIDVSSESLLYAHLDGELMESYHFHIEIQPPVRFVVNAR